MCCYCFFISVVLITYTSAIAEKLNLETLNNYSEFLNYGVKKLKPEKEFLENSVIKSKVDVLGDIFKKNIDSFKSYQKLEIIFLIDGSSSVGETNFKSELKFVKKLLSDVTVDYDHARVAIVTFSSSVTTNVDEISEPRKENNKCFLLNKLLNKIQYTGGGTYTHDAFKVAKDIFQQSRNESKKVLFLITDGFSNGGDPIPVANELKKEQVTIFTIGIQNGNYKELYELASSPGEFYSYLLDSFQEFESLARRALHVDLKSGEYIPLGINSPCSGLCDTGDCCDKFALCTCGTTSGHYSCICQPGYYGSGFQNSCLPCPPGSYSDGPNLCLPCPDLHHTTKPPAYSINSCTCKSGYQATGDNQCKTLRCPKVSTPDHGYFVKKRDCGNVLNSACGIRCEVGYTLVGSSIRLCQDNATWSGDEPTCQVKTCTGLTSPVYGSMECSHIDLGITYNETEKDFPVDTVCTFKCQNGKTLIGSSQRTCLPLARWDGLKTSCKQIKCPKLSPVKNGRIEPMSCIFGRQSYGKKCKIVCDRGYELEGPEIKTCTGNHGLWDSKFRSTTCKDMVPPTITCPANITANTRPGKKFGTTSWDHPQVTDNSDLDISVWMKPSIKNIKGFKFQIGTTLVTYFAQDAFHNRAKCTFFVTINDTEAPVIEECVDPPPYLTTDQNGANITWDEPTFFDNSHIIKFNRSHEFGFFPIGTTTVTYTVVDSSENKNSCSINITVEALEAHCEALIDPIYGHSDCSSTNNEMQCVITCQEGYAVPLSQPEESGDNSSVSFMCNDAETVWYNQEGLMFPECSVTEVPKEVELNGSVSIISELDSCNNTEKLNDIENDIKVVIQESTCIGNCSLMTQTSCQDEDAEEEKTNIIKRDVKFEEVPHRNISRRRGKKKRVNIKFQVKGKYLNQTQACDIHIPSRNVTIHYDKPEFICPEGFVPRKSRCVQCPKGTFHNTARNRCQSCPLGSYSETLGQKECIYCPAYHSTRKLHSKRREECKEQCRPGTHARKKLIRQSKRNSNVIIERATLRPHCRSCRPGYYQPSYGQLKCIACSKGYTTTSARSTSASQCIPTIEETCSKDPHICNTGKCIAINDYQYTCICPENYIGSHCEKKQGYCDSNPCLNHGMCQETNTGFKCFCPKDFSGVLCEETKEKCLLICLNNGTCHNTDANDYFCVCPTGYGGDSCEIKLNYCHNNFCENNATCLAGLNGFLCKCSSGFIGRRCNLLPCDYRPCKGNSSCVNVNVENATKSSYKCVCPEGFTGSMCDKKIDFCISSPCLNDATCLSVESNYTCTCSRFYHGRNCEFKRTSDYVLHFQKFLTTDYVKLNGFRDNLTQISACLWMQTEDNFNYGTLLSYATTQYDNAFTLTDYTGLVLYINNQYAVTDVLLNDGFWHHVCISWESFNGFYKLYVDGKIMRSGSGLAMNTEIEGNGNMVIGQEQDVLGGRFSQSETFIGRIAHVDVWSKELSPKELTTHMNDCQESIFGDVYGWPDIQSHVEGDIQIENSSFCNKCKQPQPLYNGIVDVVNNVAYYDCHKGFYLSSSRFKEGRRCTKASKWEGLYEPQCRKVYCGHPGLIRNGYPIGTNYFYQGKITYHCYGGYNITGNVTIACTENGTWYPEKPHCNGPQCQAFPVPENGNLTIVSEQNYEDVSISQLSFDIGTQIEIVCHEGANLTGNMMLTCQENETWDFEPPTCDVPVKSKISCDLAKVPPPPNNGYIVLDTLYAVGNGTGESVQFKCRVGYKLIGENSTTCIIDGYWTEPNISCKPVTCRLPKPKNMIINGDITSSYLYGNMLKFDCIEGYRMFGESTIRCLASGRWSRIKGKCSKKSCHQPMVTEDTTIEGNSFLFEDKVTLICPSGYEYVLTCNSFGVWIGEKDDTC